MTPDNYKLRLITIIQKHLHCNKGYWNTYNLQKKSLADLKNVLDRFAPVIKTVNIDSILMALFVEKKKKTLVKIQNSPHYKFLMGDTEPYLQYYKKYLAKSRIQRDEQIHSAMYTLSANIDDGVFANIMISPENYNEFMGRFEYLAKFIAFSISPVSNFICRFFI